MTETTDKTGPRFWRSTKLGSQDFSLSSRNGDQPPAASPATEYRTYKRRWFGLVQLTLMNIVVSWDVSLLHLIYVTSIQLQPL